MINLRGRAHHARQQRIAVLMVATGLLRVVIWVSLLALFLLHDGTVHGLFLSVSFVSVLSVLALALTDWGQVAASLAQLSASKAHQDAEHVRAQVTIDTATVDADIARLAELHPGPDAEALAADIRKRIQG